MLLISLLCALGDVLYPNSSSVLFGGNTYPIQWDNNALVNIRLEMYDSASGWVSHVQENHFLSVIVDQNTQEYNWYAPQYLSTYWQNPYRIKLTELSETEASSDPGLGLGLKVIKPARTVNFDPSPTAAPAPAPAPLMNDPPSTVFYSENFSFAGITPYNISGFVPINSTMLHIQWDTNINDARFDVNLYSASTNIDYYNYRTIEPTLTIVANLSNTSYMWNVSDTIYNSLDISGQFKLGVLPVSNATIGISNVFNLYYLTHAPTASPTIASTTIPPHNRNIHTDDHPHSSDDDSLHWFIIFIIVLVSFGGLLCIMEMVKIYYYKENRICPNHTNGRIEAPPSPARTQHGHINHHYESVLNTLNSYGRAQTIIQNDMYEEIPAVITNRPSITTNTGTIDTNKSHYESVWPPSPPPAGAAAGRSSHNYDLGEPHLYKRLETELDQIEGTGAVLPERPYERAATMIRDTGKLSRSETLRRPSHHDYNHLER